METSGTVHEALTQVGDFGRFQTASCVFACLMFTPIYQQILFTYFIAEVEPAWRCRANSTICNNNNTIAQNNKKIYSNNNINDNKNNSSSTSNRIFSTNGGDVRCHIPRSEWEFVESVLSCSSIAVQYDIYCSKTWLLSLATSMYFAGCVVGSILLSMLTDKYGRRVFVFPCFVATLATISASAFMPNIYLFMGCRFLVGMAGDSTTNIVIMLTSEYVTTRYRPIANNLPNVWYPFALCLLSLQAYYIRDWKKLMLVCSVPYFVLAPFIFCVFPKSPYWLQVKGRVEEAAGVCQKIGRINRKFARCTGADKMDIQISPPLPAPSVSPDTYDDGSAKKASKRMPAIISLFATKALFFKTIILAFSWFTCTVLYFGISLASNELGYFSVYLTFVISTLAELPSGLLPICLMPLIGRRLTVAGPFFIVCACSVLNIIFTLQRPASSTKIVLIAISFVGKMFATLSYNAISTWCLELYPTRIRGASFGVFILMGGLGGFAAPFIVKQLAILHRLAPEIVMSSLAFVAASSCFTLPETKNFIGDEDDLHCVARINCEIDDDKSLLVHGVVHDDDTDRNIE